MDLERIEAAVTEVHKKAYPPAIPPAIPGATTTPPVQEAPPVDTPPAQTTPPATTPPADEEALFKTRYQTLQGKYNAEVARLLGEISNLTNLTKEQEARLQKLTQPKPAESVVDDVLADPDIKFLAEEYPSVYKAVTKFTERMVQGKTKDLVQSAAKTTEELTQVKQTIGANAVLADLSASVPDWKTINVDPKFLEWLQTPAPYSGKTKQQLLTEAYAGGNAAVMAEFFNEFKGMLKPATPPKKDPKEALREEVAPAGSSSSGNLTARDHGQTYTTKQIQQFYREVAMGQWKGKEAEVAKMEAEFNLAAKEGRIVGR